MVWSSSRGLPCAATTRLSSSPKARVFGGEHDQCALQIFVTDKAFALEAADGFGLIFLDLGTLAALEQQGAKFIDIGAGQGAQPPDGLLNGLIVIEVGQPQVSAGGAAGSACHTVNSEVDSGSSAVTRMTSPAGLGTCCTLGRAAATVSIFHG